MKMEQLIQNGNAHVVQARPHAFTISVITSHLMVNALNVTLNVLNVLERQTIAMHAFLPTLSL